MPPDSAMTARVIFAFFCLGFTGWVLESIQESIVRGRLVNKGFFKGPFVPCQGLGGLGAYYAGSLFREFPLLVFLAGFILGTLVEYGTALFLEKCFKVKCWDYATYPHTKWCHFQGRISLTLSAAFGGITLFVVYVYWDWIMALAELLGAALWAADAALLGVFSLDAVFSCLWVLRAKKTGVKIRGWNVFSSNAPGRIE
jgi:uncharacterized membrane protein